MKEKTYYVTTPIYYVNDQPHIGHAYTTILADVLANYHRMLGIPTWFLTGTDEHGQKVQQAAEKNRLTPQEQADSTVVRFQELWQRLEITNDDFIRTTESRHKEIVAEVLQDLYDRDEIYRAEYEGWYCVPCERFFTERDLVENKCPECSRTVEPIKETNYFFRMSKYQDWLIEYIETHPEFIQPDFRANETLGFLKNKKLQDLCISRPKSRLSWGIELPFDKDFVTYVWFDALLNYISTIGYKRDNEKFNRWWPASIQLIGKDILTTHTVYWPTMLKAMNIELPKTVFAHGWWLTGRTKMSKSLGNVINPMEMIDRSGTDAFRYFLIAEMTLGQDASFTEDAFVRRYNSDLANDLGNVTNRIINMLHRYCDGKIPEVNKIKNPSTHTIEYPFDGTLIPVTDSYFLARKNLKDEVKRTIDFVEEYNKSMRLDLGLKTVMNTVRGINVFLQRVAPWQLVLQNDKIEIVHDCLYTAAESLRVCAALLYPIMPERMSALRAAFGLGKPALDQLRIFGVITAGTPVEKIDALFPRVEVEKAAQTFQSAQSRLDSQGGVVSAMQRLEEAAIPPHGEKEKVEGIITYDDVMNVKLRTAKVLAAEKIKDADKLLKLQIEVGDEKRQLVAGIAQYYSPADVVGKTIVIVANLKPAKIRGIESQGMLLCASTEDVLKLITIDGELPVSGAVVK